MQHMKQIDVKKLDQQAKIHRETSRLESSFKTSDGLTKGMVRANSLVNLKTQSKDRSQSKLLNSLSVKPDRIKSAVGQGSRPISGSRPGSVKLDRAAPNGTLVRRASLGSIESLVSQPIGNTSRYKRRGSVDSIATPRIPSVVRPGSGLAPPRELTRHESLKRANDRHLTRSRPGSLSRQGSIDNMVTSRKPRQNLNPLRADTVILSSNNIDLGIFMLEILVKRLCIYCFLLSCQSDSMLVLCHCKLVVCY